jgi:hypothetical protein
VLYGADDLALLGVEDRLVELGNRLALADAADGSALRRAFRVMGVFLGERGKVRAVLELLLDLLGFFLLIPLGFGTLRTIAAAQPASDVSCTLAISISLLPSPVSTALNLNASVVTVELHRSRGSLPLQRTAPRTHLASSSPT